MPVVSPAGVLLTLHWRRPHPGLLWATACMIALPSFVFVEPAALLTPRPASTFIAHVAFAIAGTLAFVGIVRGFLLGLPFPRRTE